MRRPCLILDNSANANVLLVNRGTIRPAGFDAVGLATVKEYQQFGTGGLFIELTGTLLNQFDRVAVGGQAILDGYLNLDIDGPFVPALGNTFNILTASSGVFGHFTAADVSGMPPGLTFQLNYLPNAVQVAVISGGPYETWISLFPSLTTPADRLKSANPDGDGYKNLAEFALDGDPTTGTGPGKIVAKIAPVGGSNVLTLTFPVRIYALPVPADPVGNDFIIADTYDGITYTVRATDDLPVFAVNALNVTEVTGGDAVAIQAGLPALNSGWVYRTFRCPNSIVGNPADFMEVVVSSD